MKQLKHIFVVLVFILASCSDSEKNEPAPPPPTGTTSEVTLNSDEPVMSSKGESIDFSFTSTVDWSLEVETTEKSNNWCTVSPKSGKAGTVTVTISTKENESYSDRTAYLKIKTGAKSKNVLVTQKKLDAILVSKDKYDIDPLGGEFLVEVKSNIEFEIVIPDVFKSWISEKPNNTKSLVSRNAAFVVDKSSLDNSREGIVIFKNGNLADTVHVFQNKLMGLVLSTQNINITEEKQLFDVDIRANIDYNIIIPSEVNWIKLSPSRTSRVDRATFQIDENTSHDNRTAEIYFRNTVLNLADTLTVRQSQKGALILSNKEVRVMGDQTIIDVELRTNIEYDIVISSADQSWITQSMQRGLNSFQHSFSVAQNTTGALRKGKIYFKDKKSNLQDFVTIEQEIYKSERDILIEFYNALGGDKWTKNTNWCSDKPLNEWYGINTTQEGKVQGIGLHNNNLFGDMTAGVFELPELRYLDLGQNKITSMPSSISKGNSLNSIYISYNSLTSIPKEFFELEAITHCDFSGNALEDTKLTDFFSFKNLRFLDLGGCGISDKISPSIKNCPSLFNLSLSYNAISGSIPPEIGQLTDLTYLDLTGTNISGDLPSEFANLQNLKEVLIRGCVYAGEMTMTGESLEILSKLKSLEILDLTNINLTGSIPNSIGNLSNLKELTLAQNKLSGHIPSSIGNLTNLTQLILSTNELSGEIPEIIGELKNIVALFLSDNKLSGQIPISITNLSNLNQLFLQNNNLEGNIPIGFAKLQNLSVPDGYKALVLSGNRLSGVIPQDFIENPHFHTWKVETNVLPQQKGYILTLPGHEKYESTDYSKDGEVSTLQRASVGNGIDLVFMGDGFVDRDMGTNGKYEQKMRQAMEHYFSIEPNKSYRNYFNVYAIKAISKNEIYDDNSSTVFDVEFGSGTYVGGDDGKCVVYASKAPIRNIDDTQLTIVINSDRYAGTCVMYSSGTGIAYVPLHGSDEEFKRTLLHESAGHGFAKLADEYNYAGTPEPSTIEWLNQVYENWGWYSNVDVTNNPSDIRWKHFLSHSSYSSYTGIHEGGALYQKGVWRPEENSCMRYNDLYFNAPSREAIVKRIKKIAGETYTLENFIARDKYEPEMRYNRRSVVEKHQHTPPIVVDGPFRGSPKKTKR